MQQIRFPQNEFQSFEAPLRAEIDIRGLEVVQGEVPEHLDGGFYRLLGDRQWPSFIENDIFLLNEDGMASCLRIPDGRVDFRTRYCRRRARRTSDLSGGGSRIHRDTPPLGGRSECADRSIARPVPGVPVSTPASPKEGRNARTAAVAAIGCGICIGFGIIPLFIGTFPVFLKPVSDEFGWSLSLYPQASLLVGLAGAVVGPFVGRLIDRYGVRRTLPFGLVLWCAGFFSLSLIGGQPAAMYLVALLMALGATIAGPISYAKVISGWFDKNRGLALGLVLSGVPAIATAVAVPVSAGLIEADGWRAAYRMLAVVAAAVTIPVSILLIREAPARHGAGPALSRDEGLTGSQALRSRAFLMVIGSNCLVIAGLVAVTNHIVAWTTGQGVSPDTATFALSLYSLVGPVGPLVGGFVMDRVPSPKNVAAFLLLSPIGMALLFLGGTPGLLTGMALLGLTYSSITGLVPLLVTRYCGMKASSEILGGALAALTISMGIGPVLLGLGHDLAGGYAVPMAIVAGVITVGFIGSLFLPTYRYVDSPRQQNDSPVLEGSS
ncbi:MULTISPECIES: MFS transporter [unclassified Streptomyces]|uniref:MFS transporter n=1 Tax=unclassified Streptomyces TaxID=2593676 RepID=UPI0024754809|nr:MULTISPECIES: MFS transporter [unclassified Streptomyces]MDH6454292.1 putative MFS family arabinose efflux permease [Streptomyces sp. SAI-119]MDH6495148.1 putative MFS family arabinose efflux permease [Streptomyces sp. SAI-149]